MRRRCGAVTLRAGPGAAADGNHLLFAGRAQAVVHVLLMRHRIEAVGLDARSDVVTHLVVVGHPAEVVAWVQPERLDAQVHVVALPALPQKGSGIGVRRIVLQRAGARPVRRMFGRRSRRVARPPRFRAVRPPHVEAPAVELREVFAAFFHHHPGGNHDSRAQVVELAHHGRRVGPELRVELPVAPMAPVPEIDHQHRHRQAAALEFPRRGKELLLGPIAQFALPEAGCPLREQRSAAGHPGVVAHDVGVAVAGGDVVVELAAAARYPAGHVVAEFDPPQRRVVPQQAVAFARYHERHDVLAVALVQVDDAPFQVDPAGGVEPHAVQPLPGPRREVMLGVVQPGFARRAARLEDAAARIVAPDHVVMLRQNRNGLGAAAGMAEELQARVRAPGSPVRQPRRDPAIAHGRFGGADRDRGRVSGGDRLGQRPGGVENARPDGHPDSQGVRPPRNDGEEFDLRRGEGAGVPRLAGVDQPAAGAFDALPQWLHR